MDKLAGEIIGLKDGRRATDPANLADLRALNARVSPQ